MMLEKQENEGLGVARTRGVYLATANASWNKRGNGAANVRSWIRFLGVVVMAATVSAGAEGATLARWDTTGANTAQGSYEATETAEGVTAIPLEIGSGLTAGGATATDIFAAYGYNSTSAAEAMEAGDYWETCLAVEAGYELQLTGITVAFGGPKAGPTTCQLAWSTDDKKTWTYLPEFDLTRTMTTYFLKSLSESELVDVAAGTVWFRLVAWGGGAALTACGSFGKGTDGIVFEGELISTEGVPTAVRFRPEEPLAYVGEMLTVLVKARPSGAKVTSITVNPTPEGIVTPNLQDGTWTFVPGDADYKKTFTVTVTVANEYGETTGSTDVHVNGTVVEESGVTWRFCHIEETATVTGASPAEGELIIPSFLGGYPVTSIGEGTFSNCSGLTSVTIPDSVTTIASNAFAHCNGLTSVTVPQVVCDQGLASVFPASYQLLTNVTIETTVTRIGYNAFYGCYSLADLTIPNCVTNIERGAFSGCSGLTSVMLPESVTTIGSSAFSDCIGLTSVTIPNSVENIGSSAFSGCSGLASVHIHDLATWSALSFSGGFPNPHRLFLNGEEVTDLVIPEGATSIGEGPFSCCIGLKSVSMPRSVTNIGQRAFCECTNLLELELSSGLTSIGANAFFGCCSLEALNIPPSVGRIGDNAFMGCSALSSLSIGSGVRCIGNQAFSGCTSLETVTLPKHVSSIGKGVFSNCTSLTSVLIFGNVETTGVSSDYSSPFYACSNLKSLVFGTNVTTIGNYLCCGLNNLTSVVIPSGVTNIGNRAFYECMSLNSLKFPKGLLFIGTRSLSGCASLTSLVIPSTVTYIGSYTFENCQSLATLYVPASWEGTDKLDRAMVPSTCEIVYGDAGGQEESGGTEIIGEVSWTYAVSNSEACIVHVSPTEGELIVPPALGGYLVVGIEDGAFSGCSELAALTIPDSVTSVGADVFAGCDGLNELHVPAWWTGTDILANASVPATCEIVYGEDDLNAESINGVTWFYIASDDMVTIMDVFPAPEDLIIPAMIDGLPVERIGCSAFAENHALKSATLPESVTHIGWYAFQGCSALETVTILGDVMDDWKKDGESPFLGCSSLNTVRFGKNMTKIGNYMFDQCSALQSLIIPDGITNIGNRAFGYSSSLTSLELGQGLVRIGDATFRTCTSLKSVTIPNSVTTIGAHAFYQCSRLEEVTVGSGTRGLSQAAFRDCNSLKSVTLPDGLERIGSEVFYNCTALSTLRIPASVTNIWSKVFYGCTSLETLWIPASWEGTDMLAKAAVPDSCTICYYVSNAGENKTTTTPVPVPHSWLEENAASLLDASTNDYETVASGPAANDLLVWECYVADLNPMDENATFKMKSISFENGQPVVKWDPDLNEEGRTDRMYRVWARSSLEVPEPEGEGTEDGWKDVTGQEASWVTNGWRFFRVSVEMAE